MYIGLELLEMYIGLWGVARDVHSSSGGELMKKYIAPLCVKGKGQSDTQYKTISIHAVPAGGHSLCKVTNIGTWFQFRSAVIAILKADQDQSKNITNLQ